MEQLIRLDGRYPPDAFAFLHDGLVRAVKDVYGDKEQFSAQRHVSGAQLCMALRHAAIERWGFLARIVLRKWNINSTMDFGNMVFLLVDNGFLRKSDEDSLEDFRDVFDFGRAFRVSREFELKE